MSTIIISPSGNLYGSEQVFLEFINSCKAKYTIWLPKNSLLEKEIKKSSHTVKTFKKVVILYSKVFLKLLFSKSNLYINEAGHIRYVKLMARLLPHKKFYVHIRLLEDCSQNRLKNITNNISLITISKYLKKQISPKYSVRIIYDPYTLQNNVSEKHRINEPFTIGIVGRVTPTKGLNLLYPILQKLTEKPNQTIKLSFFGSFDRQTAWFKQFKKQLIKNPSITIDFKGFVSSKQEIYSNIDLLIHLNKIEALGRILFEAVDSNTPYLAFKKGGCGELSSELGLDDFLIQENNNWVEFFVQKITFISQNRDAFEKQLQNAKEIIKNKFDSKNYAQSLESFFNS